MQMLKMCLNWKVLAALAVLGAGMYAIAPNLAVAALPFLLLAICPLSMMFMMKGMQGMQGTGAGGGDRATAEAGPTREEELVRLRSQQADVNDRIGVLEESEPQATRNGREG
ncbi:MAG: DUF2933 domain-containing protein [Rubrobacteraceae bacterium]